MTWQPGTPVLTPEDRAAWKAWRAERKRQQQRERRARFQRIDYYASDQAVQALYALCTADEALDLSSALNRVVTEGAAQCHRNSGQEGLRSFVRHGPCTAVNTKGLPTFGQRRLSAKIGGVKSSISNQ